MIRKLMQSIREFKLFSLLSPLFVVLEVVMEVVIPILMAKPMHQTCRTCPVHR